MDKTDAAIAAKIQAEVVDMYGRFPFPSIENKAQKAEDEMEMRLTMLGVKPEDYVGKKVLDAGCGTGEYSCWYARRGADVTGVDLSEPSMKIAADYANREGIDNIRFVKQSVLNLDFPDASFDYVYSMGVLHHTPDPYGGFLELCRVLKPGGVLIVSLYNRFGRLHHNAKQFIVQKLAGENVDKRVALAKKLFPGTCRALKRNRHSDSDVIIYDAFGIPHESQHTAGELIGWFDENGLDYQGAFGPLTIADNIKALKLMQHGEFSGFGRFFDGFPLARNMVNTLPKVVGRLSGDVSGEELRFSRPSMFSRGLVQLAWFVLGFRFSIFAISGRKPIAKNT